jgi:hypothetical protein
MFTAGRFSELLLERARWNLPASERIRAELPPAMYELLQALVERSPENRTCDLEQLAKWAAPVDSTLLAVAEERRPANSTTTDAFLQR